MNVARRIAAPTNAAPSAQQARVSMMNWIVFMVLVGCAGDGTRLGWLDHFNSAVAINAHHSKCSIDVDG